MILDTLCTFAADKSLSGASVTGDVLDCGKSGINDQTFYCVVRNAGAVTGVTSVAVEGSEDKSTWKTFVAADYTDLTDGGGVNLKFPQGSPRYLRLKVTGSSMTGKINAYGALQAPSPRGKRIGDFEAHVRG